MEIDP
jgi:ribonuclease HI